MKNVVPTMWHKTFGPVYIETTREIPSFVSQYKLNVEFFPKGRTRNGPALYVDLFLGVREYGLTIEHKEDVDELNGEIDDDDLYALIQQVFGAK